VVLPRRLPAVTALLALLLGSAGCGLFGESGEEAPDGFVSLGVTQPTGLLPSDVSDAGGMQVVNALFTPLVTYDAGRQPVNAAARAITTRDRRLWTIALADGYTFHNGEKVTAQNYVDAWNYAAYGPNRQRNSYLFERIEGFAATQGATPASTTLSGLKVLDASTFTVTLVAPFVDFPAMLGHPAFSPLPQAAFASPGALAAGFDSTVIGQGPFRLAGAFTSGRPIDVRRYDPAVRKAQVAGVRFRVYADPAQAYTDLTEGDLDIATAIPDERAADAARELGDRLLTTPGSSLTMLAFPASAQDLRAPAVRRAISMALDRDALVAALFPGAETPARSFVPPTVAGYRADACGAPCTFDPTAAKAAYRAAGGPTTLRITYNTDGGHRRWVEATCAQLAANLGVTCTPAAEPTFDALLTKVRGQQPVGMFRMTWFMDYPSQDSYLTPLFTSDGSSNFARYRSPALDTAVRDATASPDRTRALAVYARAQAVLARDMPVIPLRFGLDLTGRSARVGNVTVDVFDRVDVSALTLR
jgi:peptide/nickel transport system substrate-binding protein/oligopeptide transport system substrate-binding protein